MIRAGRKLLIPLFLVTFLLTHAVSASAAPGADARIGSIQNTQWSAMVKAGVWHPGCPVSQAQLRKVSVNFWGFDGTVHRGALVVHADVSASVARIFTQLFEAGFPIRKMEPIEAFNGDDNASMAADNTSAFNCRRSSQANSPVSLSPHANGRAIDVNPMENPWLDPRCNCFQPDAKFSLKRSGQGVITKGSSIWRAFTSEGWIWQNTAKPDYQHFDTGYPSRPLTKLKNAVPFPIPVAVGNATQVITVKASGHKAILTAWEQRKDGWHKVISTTSAYVGAKGITNGASRRQNTSTTPSGTFTITQGFGILANPGTSLPYHLVNENDWWVEDNNSPYYNSMRSSAEGGFDMQAPENSVNGSEHLIKHIGQYNYSIVINYNMDPPVPYRGAGIFLHVSNGRPTAGCVSVPTKTMVALLRWLKPTANPRIAIN